MDVLGATASIIAIVQLAGKATSLTYGYIAGVKRAPEDIQQLVDELMALSKVLICLKECIDQFGPESRALQTIKVPLGGCQQELERLESRLTTSSLKRGWRKMIGSLKWPFKETETAQIIGRIERHKNMFIIALQTDNILLSKEIGTGVKAINSSVQVLQTGFENESSAQSAYREKENIIQMSKKRKDVLSWLYPENTNTKHIEISERRQQDTGSWLLRSPELLKLINEQQDPGLLWGYGIPGAGKTFLSSRVIDYLRGLAPAANYAVAYIYFDYKECGQQRPVHILASLIKQLVGQMQTLKLPKELERLYDSDEREMLTAKELYIVLVSTFESFSKVFLIFDALDECDQKSQRKELLPFFHQMGRDGARLFLTSRQYPEDIQESFRTAAVPRIELSAQTEDIRSYIRAKINESSRAKRLVQGAKCEEKVISELSNCANGMFLLVRFHVEYLCQQTSSKQLLAALEILKHSSTAKQPLDPTYDRVIEAISKQAESCTNLAIRVLSWLVKTKRTLTIQELQTAVSVELEPGRFKLDELDPPDKITLLDVCGGLVTIDDNSDTIRLAHLTVQEYLLRKSILEDTDYTLAKTCISYLSSDVFSKACSSNASLETRLQSYTFISYAAQYLNAHLKDSDEKQSMDDVLKFLTRPGNMSSWMQVKMYMMNNREVEDTYHTRFLKLPIPLHAAAYMGHSLAAQYLLEGDADGIECLEIPQVLGQVKTRVCHQLIQHVANISTQDDLGRTALHLAAMSGNQAVLKLLLQKDSDVSTQDTDGKTALHLAALNGHKAVVKLLLEKGSDVSTQDTNGSTALHLAAFNGHEAVVKLLLEKGSDVSTQDTDGSTALILATSNGHEAVVKLLLRGADDSEALGTVKNGELTPHDTNNQRDEAVAALLSDN